MRGHEVYLALFAAGLILILLKRWTLPRWRTAILIASVAVLGFMRLDLPSVHCIVEGFFSRLTLEFIKAPMWIKLAVAFASAPLVGRVFCGYVCPKGAAQELVFIRRWRLKIPTRVDRVLRLLPYVSLAVLIVLPVVYHRRLWTEMDPYLWLFQLHGHWPGLVMLGLVLPLSLFVMRPFCRYLCPLVPIFRLLSRPTLLRRRTDQDLCRACKSGVKSCDFDVITLAPPKRRKKKGDDAPDPSKAKPACKFNAAECLQCGSCGHACPRKAIS
jgi:polyferredoxin